MKLLTSIAAALFLLTQPSPSLSASAGEAAKVDEVVKTVVIDAGHGGKDSGAVGPGGVKEKDITLKVAKELKDALEELLDVKVLLTRDDDTFIALHERADFANKAGADVFISIHVNSAKRAGANGVETFFLDLDASDDEARETAAFENGVIRFEEDAGGEGPTDDLKAILWDLTQTAAHHESSRLAESIQSHLADISKGDDRGIKQAPFIVLFGATMPAVLVEIGFISNPTEEKTLSGATFQKRVASAISKGVSDFDDVHETQGGGLAIVISSSGNHNEKK